MVQKSRVSFPVGIIRRNGPISMLIPDCLIASGILKTGDIGSVHSWRKIFVVEGIVTVGLAVVAFFILTDRPATARFLTQEEKGECCNPHSDRSGYRLTLASQISPSHVSSLNMSVLQKS